MNEGGERKIVEISLLFLNNKSEYRMYIVRFFFFISRCKSVFYCTRNSWWIVFKEREMELFFRQMCLMWLINCTIIYAIFSFLIRIFFERTWQEVLFFLLFSFLPFFVKIDTWKKEKYTRKNLCRIVSKEDDRLLRFVSFPVRKIKNYHLWNESCQSNVTNRAKISQSAKWIRRLIEPIFFIFKKVFLIFFFIAELLRKRIRAKDGN